MICVVIIWVVDNILFVISGGCVLVMVSCLDSMVLEVIGLLIVIDNCDIDLELMFIDNLILCDCLIDIVVVILWEWIVMDYFNFMVSCMQQINILRVLFMDVSFLLDVVLFCDDLFVDFDCMGIFELNGMVFMYGDLCGLDVSFVDDIIYICNDYMY